jgi:hypothetical protein
MIGGVADHVGQRVFDKIKNLTIKFGLGTNHLKVDVLAKFAGKITHDPRQLLPRIANRLHARLHDAFLQFCRHIGQALQRHFELRILVATDNFQQLVAGKHQLGHHRHQVFKRIDRYTDRLRCQRLLAILLGLTSSAWCAFRVSLVGRCRLGLSFWSVSLGRFGFHRFSCSVGLGCLNGDRVPLHHRPWLSLRPALLPSAASQRLRRHSRFRSR